MAFSLAGEKIFQMLKVPTPAIYFTFMEKKWMVLIGVFFITNTLSGKLKNTGAYEVYINDQLFHSKL
jgi:hypothetical protein